MIIIGRYIIICNKDYQNKTFVHAQSRSRVKKDLPTHRYLIIPSWKNTNNIPTTPIYRV